MTWDGCVICGREDDHAKWCARIRKAMAERDAGGKKRPGWPLWMSEMGATWPGPVNG